MKMRQDEERVNGVRVRDKHASRFSIMAAQLSGLMESEAPHSGNQPALGFGLFSFGISDSLPVIDNAEPSHQILGNGALQLPPHLCSHAPFPSPII
jgi:hypothetical protein